MTRKLKITDIVKLVNFVQEMLFGEETRNVPDDWSLPLTAPAPFIEQDALKETLAGITEDVDVMGLDVDGILISLRAYDAGWFYNYRRMVVEGLGRTPHQALLNSLADADDGALKQLNDEAAEAMGALFPNFEGPLTPRPEEDVGIFLQRRADGGWSIKGREGYFLLDDYREDAAEVYAEAKAMMNTLGLPQVEQIVQRGQGYREIRMRYADALDRRGVLSALDRAMASRREATELLRQANREMAKAKKWADVAAGIGLAAQLTSIASQVASYTSKTMQQTHLSNQLESINAELKSVNSSLSQVESTVTSAFADLNVKIDAFNAQLDSITTLDKTIADLFGSVLPGLLLPKGATVHMGDVARPRYDFLQLRIDRDPKSFRIEWGTVDGD